MADPLKIYKALADETRLRLLRLLVRGPLNVNELIEILKMGQSRVSRHLKILAEAGLLTSRREGTWSYYQGNGQASDPLTAQVLELLQRHERVLPRYAEDLQALESVIERRREKTRTFFDSIKDPCQLPQHPCLDGTLYRQVALDLMPQEASVALDMGTGAGLLLPGLLEKVERVIAVDSSTTMLDMARRTAGGQAHRCDFRLGDLAHLPVADNEVDVAMACMVLHHLSRPAETIREAHRALKKGGHFIIVDLNQHQDESLREKLADLWLGFPPEEVRLWLEQNHFTLIGADRVGQPDSLQLITFKGKKT